MSKSASRYIDPAMTKTGPYAWCDQSSQYPTEGATSIPPIAPPSPPKPTTEPIAPRGNISDASVNRFADQPWCAAAARLTRATAAQRFPPEYITSITGVTAAAQISMEVFRARFKRQPRFRNTDEIQPPPIDP